MALKNVLVKDLQGVETLGALTLLATDKTGTLTRNQMTVSNAWTGQVMYTEFQVSFLLSVIGRTTLNDIFITRPTTMIP